MNSHNTSRRTVLKLLSGSLLGSSFGLAATSCTHKKFFNPDEDILLSGSNITDDKSLQNALIVINLTQSKKRIIKTSFFPHGVCIDPNNKYRIFCFEKNSTNACEINLKSLKVTQYFTSTKNHTFSGHAAFSENSNEIYCIENNINTRQGAVIVRNSDTFEAIKRLPTLGLSANDCHLIEAQTLVISNTGRSESDFHQPSLVYIDLETEKLLKRIKLDDKNLNCGHFDITEKGDLVIASAPVSSLDETLSGGVSIQPANEKLTTMTQPEPVIKRMTGEALSITINKQYDIVAVTHPQANLLTFWSITQSRIIKAYGIENPRGICQTLDGKYFVVSYGRTPAIAKISSKMMTPVADSIVRSTLATSDHMINWSAIIRKIMPARIYD
ncbi:MAG: hypothetical protein COB77_02520 [Gammaproteobacteria bacterium]|nr:MAG: hypothetical protein COB77_02520 [Gammaproteobacteria bacterium]